MSGINKVILVGNLGQNPELRYTSSGNKAVATLRVATNRHWTGNDGLPKEKTEWHTVTLWGQRAEQAAKYLSKGRQVYVEGRLETQEYKNKEGERRWSTKVVGEQIVYLGNAKQGREGMEEPVQDAIQEEMPPEFQ